MVFHLEYRASSSDRVPAVDQGCAIVYTKYRDEQKSVVVNPVDFERLAEIEAALDVVCCGGLKTSDLAMHAYLTEAVSQGAIEDADTIKALLDL